MERRRSTVCSREGRAELTRLPDLAGDHLKGRETCSDLEWRYLPLTRTSGKPLTCNVATSRSSSTLSGPPRPSVKRPRWLRGRLDDRSITDPITTSCAGATAACVASGHGGVLRVSSTSGTPAGDCRTSLTQRAATATTELRIIRSHLCPTFTAHTAAGLPSVVEAGDHRHPSMPECGCGEVSGSKDRVLHRL